ncbi:MAG: uroporphyrinogen decarboxylase family protein [Anaerolineae bacterium]|jgi:hypothetical protein|nr:uroporphyrinogen decarboxylase family protein [Anaerolineae bacterium]
MPLKWSSHADLRINRNESINREEYIDHMRFRKNERPLFTEIFGPLLGLKEEWEAQGAAPSELDFSAFQFRCEKRYGVAANTGLFGAPAEQVLEDTDEHLIMRDGLGRTMRLVKQSATLPLPLDYPVTDWESWERIKPLYQYHDGRLADGWLETAIHKQAQGNVISISIPGGFDEPRQLMGEALLCMAVFDQPDLVQDILHTISETALKVLDQVTAQLQVDRLFVHEDMAGKSGPLFGPRQIRKFVLPYYRKVWDFVSERGVQLFDQDSDGNMNKVIDVFLEAGVNCMHPMEPAAGMDIVQIREQYGQRLAFYGGIDKHVLRKSKEEIAAELAYKVPPMVHSGGCVLALDHRIPNGTPLENYRFYIQKMWEIFKRETK